MENSKNRILYEKMVQYPINKAVLYNVPPVKQPILETTPRYRTLTNNEMVYYNLMSIQPNIDMGVYNSHTEVELREWINTSREYIEDLANTYKTLCDVEEKHLNNIIDQRKKCKALRLDYISQLPEDLIRYIKMFCLPETQITLYKECNPKLDDMLSRLTVARLKKFYKEQIIPKYYNDFMTSPWKRWIFTNSLKPNNIHISPTTKPEFVKEIKNVLNLLHNVIPHTAEIYNYCQLRGLKLIKSMLYVSKRFAPAPAKLKVVAEKKTTTVKRPRVARKPRVTQNNQTDENTELTNEFITLVE